MRERRGGQRNWRMTALTDDLLGHGEIGTMFILVGGWRSCRRERQGVQEELYTVRS